MIRSLGMIISACCVATLLSEVVGLGILWHRGQLTASTIRNVRAVLSGQETDSMAAEEAAPKDDVSTEDVVKDRSLRVLEFNTLQNELTVLKTMVDSNKTSLLAEKNAFLKMQEDFDRKLKQLDTDRTSAAAQKTQAVLLAMAPADAVESLMRLTLDENVMLLTEMPEKKVAFLLKEFSAINDNSPNAQARKARGQQIFEALSRGEPARSLIRDTAGKLEPRTSSNGPTANGPTPAEPPRGN